MELRAYEGSEKYIFVSYAHKDSKAVFRVLSQLIERGYNIWYDEGITPGSEWPEDIAQHLNGSEAVLAFITPNSVASTNCRREITFALSRQKPFLSVFLEKTELPLGMELQLSSQQSVLRYNYPSEAVFLEKICTFDALKPCLKQSGNSLGHVETKLPAQAAASEVPANPQEAKKTAAAPKVKKQKPAREKKKGRLPKILSIIAAVIVLAAVSVAIVSAASKTTIAGSTVKKSAHHLSLTGKTITPDDIAKINKLKKLGSISITGCAFESNAADMLATTATDIKLNDCTGIERFDFLTNSSNLDNLAIRNCGLSQLPDLTGFSLRSVYLSDNSAFDALEMLPLSKVVTLDISRTAVSTLEPLRSCEQLKTLLCSGNAIRDISIISELSSLKELDFSGCRLTTVTEPFTCLYLEKLNLANNALTDVSGFSDITVLKELDLSGNEITSIPWAEKNVATLTVLSLSGNPLDASALSFVKDCAQLQTLHLDDIALGDLSFCAKMPNLKNFSAIHCDIEDISSLANCKELAQVYLAFNRISDISALSGAAFGHYSSVLDLACNNIADVTPLNGLQIGCLALQYNPLSVRPDSFNELKCSVLAIDYTDGLDTCGLTQHHVINIYLVGCPNDRQVALKKALGYYVQFATREEQLEALNPKINYEKWQQLLPDDHS